MPEMPINGILISTPQLADVLDVAIPTITKWKQLGLDAAYVKRGTWNLKTALYWWLDNIYSGDTDSPSLQDAH